MSPSQKPPGQPAACEAALRALASKKGPSLKKLLATIEFADDDDDELLGLLRRTETFDGATPQVRALALWELIQEEIANFPVSDEDDMRELHALQAAFRLPAQDYAGSAGDSIPRRLALAKTAGLFAPRQGQDMPQTLWRRAVRKLGYQVENRLEELAHQPEVWAGYRRDEFPPPPHDAQPIVMNRLTATYVMRGRAVHRATTERLVTAQADGVDRYVVRAYSPRPGKHDVQIEALLNCKPGPRATFAGRGSGETHEVAMYCPKPLKRGEQWFFASQVSHQQGAGEDPVVEIQVTSHGIAAGGLTLRVQFDEGFFPTAVWWFADVPEHRQLAKPPSSDPHRLRCSPFGYVEHTFGAACRPLGRYGLGWEW